MIFFGGGGSYLEWDLLLYYTIGRKYEYKVWRRQEGEDNVNIEVATKLFFSNVLSQTLRVNISNKFYELIRATPGLH